MRLLTMFKWNLQFHSRSSRFIPSPDLGITNQQKCCQSHFCCATWRHFANKYKSKFLAQFAPSQFLLSQSALGLVVVLLVHPKGLKAFLSTLYDEKGIVHPLCHLSIHITLLLCLVVAPIYLHVHKTREPAITIVKNSLLPNFFVVYFNQWRGAPHAVCWS